MVVELLAHGGHTHELAGATLLALAVAVAVAVGAVLAARSHASRTRIRR